MFLPGVKYKCFLVLIRTFVEKIKLLVQMESIQKYLREGVYWRVFEPEIPYVVKSLRVFNVGGGGGN